MPAETIIAIDKVANRIRFYDPALVEIGSIEGPEPCVHELAMAPDGRTAYVPLYGDGIYGNNRQPNNKILAIDLAARRIADVIDLGPHLAPHGMAATSGGLLFVTCDIPDRLLCVDPASRRVAAVHDIPSRGGHLVELLPDESTLYVSAKEGPLAVFDIAAGRFVATVPVAAPGVTAGNGAGTEGLKPTPDGRRLVAIDNDRSDLRVIDTATNREIARHPLLPFVFTNPRRSRLAKLGFSPDGRWLVATAYAGAQCWVIDAADFSRQAAIPLAKGPMGILFEPGDRTALVSSHDSGVITRIDLESARAIAAFDGGGGIEVMAWC